MGDVECGKIYDIYFPPPYLRLFDGPAVNIVDMWRILGRDRVNDGLYVGTFIKPELGLRPKPFGEACYAFSGSCPDSGARRSNRGAGMDLSGVRN